MPSDTPLRRRRATAVAVAVALLAPVGSGAPAVADDLPPVSAIEALSRLVSDRSAGLAAAAMTAPSTLAASPADARPTALPALVREFVPDVGAAWADAAMAPTTRERIAAGCPDLDDPQLLRGGAAADGRGLCERSVHAARSDAAAAAVVEGFGLLGLPYSRSRRGRDGYDDCSSFVGRAYREAGRPLSDSDWEPSSRVMPGAPWASDVDEPLPGDILWRRGHVAIALADGYMMHTSQPGDVTHVRPAGRYTRILAVDAPA